MMLLDEIYLVISLFWGFLIEVSSWVFYVLDYLGWFGLRIFNLFVVVGFVESLIYGF